MPTNDGKFKGIIIRNTSAGTEEKYLINNPISTDVTTNIEVGGIPSGTQLKGMTFEQFALALTVKDLAPTVTIYSPVVTVYKKGILETVILRADAIRKDTEITRIDIFVNNSLYKTITDSTSISEQFRPIDTTTYKIRATDATNYGENSRTITFVDPTFYGIESDLTEVLQTSKGSTRSYTFVNDKAVYKYPKSFGALSKITDGSGITDYTSSFNRTEEIIECERVDSEGTHLPKEAVPYYNYTLKDATTLTNFEFKFA